MLSTFFIQNFRSILELKLDFSYGEGKAPNGYQEQELLPFIQAGSSERIVPCMAFFGSNASGKTNLLKAAVALWQIVVSGSKLADSFEPNLLNQKFSNTKFIVEFFINGQLFEYRLAYDSTEILEESLNKNGFNLYSTNLLSPEFSNQIISATYSQEKLSDILRVECSDGEGKQIKPFLNRIGLGYPGLNSDLKSTFTFFKDRFKVIDNTNRLPLPIAIEFLASTLNGDKKAALREITDFIRRLDIDILDIDINEKELASHENNLLGITRIDTSSGKRDGLQLSATHKDSSGKLTAWDFFKHESAGTQKLTEFVGLFLYALKTGSTLFVDELECSLHPLLIREIVMFFKTRRHNCLGAQLIFTTHNTDILDDSVLRLSEIALVKKTLANGTLVRRLVDAKNEGEDIRNVTNFRKQYLAGFYSGVPHPAL